MGFAYPGGRGVFLVVAIATHGVVGYALGAHRFDAPRAGTIGGLLADLDFFFPAAWEFPLVHRGGTHTVLALAVAAALTAGVADRQTGGAVGIGYVAHLAIDATTPRGVPLFYPVNDASHGVVLSGHSPTATALLWVCCLGVLWLDRTEKRPVVAGDLFEQFRQ
jgi:inner membrane protein